MKTYFSKLLRALLAVRSREETRLTAELRIAKSRLALAAAQETLHEGSFNDLQAEFNKACRQIVALEKDLEKAGMMLEERRAKVKDLKRIIAQMKEKEKEECQS